MTYYNDVCLSKEKQNKVKEQYHTDKPSDRKRRESARDKMQRIMSFKNSSMFGDYGTMVIPEANLYRRKNK